MIKVRKDLGYKDIHLGAGQYRSKIANKVNKAGLKFEHQIEKILIDKFGEPFVHIQRRVGEFRDRIDFFVYNQTENFAVDVTNTTGHFRNLQGNINTKIRKYHDLNIKLYIVVNSFYKQDKIDSWVLKKITQFPLGWKIVTIENFIGLINVFKRYEI